MRRIIVFISLTVILTTGWILYLNLEKKNFIENLPQLPAVARQPIKNQVASIVDGAMSIPDDRMHEKRRQDQSVSTEKTSSEVLTPDEKADFVRDQWIQMFGDIPEVHVLTEYTRKQYKKERLTIDEEIAGLEAAHFLFPTGGHGILLEMRKSLKARGIPLIYEEDMGDIPLAEDHKVIVLGDIRDENGNSLGYREYMPFDASVSDSMSLGNTDEDMDALQARSEKTPIIPEPTTSVTSDHVHHEDRHVHEPPTLRPPAPTAAKSVEANGWEGLSLEQREQAKQLFDEYGTAEGLRRLREMDPDAARRFERGHPPQSPRKQGEDRGQPPGDAP